MAHWLVITVFTPLAGAGLVALLGQTRPAIARWIALATTLVVAALAGRIVLGWSGDVLSYEATWLSQAAAGVDVRFSLGLDGLSLWLFGLTALLMVTAVLVGWEAIREGVAGYYSLLLLLEAGMLGVFAARDLILFYVFFEFTLIPLFFLIGIWGSEDRRYAAIKFFLFTLAGSVLTFLGLLAIVWWVYDHSHPHVLTFSIPALQQAIANHPQGIDPQTQLWIFLALFAGFAIKVPLFPLHTWLPLAHVQAPTAGSVILAGVLLKIGTYGFVRFSLPMLPAASAACMPWILWLALGGILYGAFIALAQQDVKRLIAYSSVSHLGFCMLGLFALNKLGLIGGVMQMINHGLSTGGLFAVVGMLYERYHTREIAELGGLARRTPRLAFFMLVFTLSSIGLPGLNGFVGELLILIGMFQRGWGSSAMEWSGQWRVISVAAVLGVVLGAWYMLWLVERVFFGPIREPRHHDGEPPIRDIGLRETLALAPLVVFIVWIGVAPERFLAPIRGAVDPIAIAAERALVIRISADNNAKAQREIARVE